MSTAEWVSIIGVLTVLLNAIAAVFWGAKTIGAKDAHIATLKGQVESLTATNNEIVKAKNEQIEVIRLQLLDIKELSPKTLHEYVIHTRELLTSYSDALKADLEATQKKNTELQQQIESERGQAEEAIRKSADERNFLLERIETLRQQYSRNQEALAAIEGLEQSDRPSATLNRKGVFIGAYIPNELQASLKQRASDEGHTLSQYIKAVLTESVIHGRFRRAMFADFTNLTAEQFIRTLETQIIVVNLMTAERDALVNGLESGTETYETAFRKVEDIKKRKHYNVLNEIVRILDNGGSESERIARAKAVAVDILLVPTF